MKKILITVFLTFLLVTGCKIEKISNRSVNDILSSVLYKDNKLVNTYMNGFEFYLPQGMKITDKSDYNLVIKDQKNSYYLYVDTIAYYYHVKNSYIEDNSHFYSKKILYQDKEGFIDIVDKGNYYFVVLMYNYSKMEAYVLKDEFDISIISMCSILNSVKFNDYVIKDYVGKDGSAYQEEKFNIFDSKEENDKFLKYEEEYGTYKESIVPNKDNDVIEIDDVVE